MGGVFTHRLGMNGAGGGTPTEDAFAAWIALEVDANGKANGTGYTTENSRYAELITYTGNAAIASGKFTHDGTGDLTDLNNRYQYVPKRQMTWELFDASTATANNGDYNALIGSNGQATAQYSYWFYEYNGTIWFTASPDGTTLKSVNCGSYTAGAVIGHLSASWDGTNVYCHRDGAYVGTIDLAAVYPLPNSSFVIANALRGGNDYYSDLSIRGVRLTRKARYATTSAITAMPLGTPAAAYTDANWPLTYWLLAGTNLAASSTALYDESPSDCYTLTNTGSAAVSSTQVQGGNSIYFNGAGQYIQVNESSADAGQRLFDLRDRDFTFDFTVRFETITGSTYRTLFGVWHSSTASLRSYLCDLQSGNTIRFLWYDNTGTQHFTTFSWTPSLATNYHFRVSRSGNTFYFFVDGVSVHSYAMPSGSEYVRDGNFPFIIGNFGNAATANPFKGWINEFRHLRTALSTSTASYTPPTTPYSRG